MCAFRSSQSSITVGKSLERAGTDCSENDLLQLSLTPPPSPPQPYIPYIKRHLGRFTGLDIILTSHLQNTVCKTHLTQNLGTLPWPLFFPKYLIFIHANQMPEPDGLIRPMTEDIEYWLEEQISIGPGSYKTVNAYGTLLHIVAGVSSRVFVGQPRNRDEE